MTLEDFIAKRKAGKYKKNWVRVWLDQEFSTELPSDIPVKTNAMAPRFDARPFVGMSVFITTEKYDTDAMRVFESLHNVASFVLIAFTDFGDDIGWKWSKETGVVAV